jgi:hypothetical protein
MGECDADAGSPLGRVGRGLSEVDRVGRDTQVRRPAVEQDVPDDVAVALGDEVSVGLRLLPGVRPLLDERRLVLGLAPGEAGRGDHRLPHQAVELRRCSNVVRRALPNGDVGVDRRLRCCLARRERRRSAERKPEPRVD